MARIGSWPDVASMTVSTGADLSRHGRPAQNGIPEPGRHPGTPGLIARGGIAAERRRFNSLNEIKIKPGQIFAGCPCDSRSGRAWYGRIESGVIGGLGGNASSCVGAVGAGLAGEL